jgi:hypothetical protein
METQDMTDDDMMLAAQQLAGLAPVDNEPITDTDTKDKE